MLTASTPAPMRSSTFENARPPHSADTDHTAAKFLIGTRHWSGHCTRAGARNPRTMVAASHSALAAHGMRVGPRGACAGAGNAFLITFLPAFFTTAVFDVVQN